MKKGGLAILVASKKPMESEESDEGGSELKKGAEAVAKEMWDAIKADDKGTFVKAMQNYCELMAPEEEDEEEEA